MRNVQNTVVDDTGQPMVGVRVEIYLLAPGLDDTAFDNNSNQIIGKVITTTDDDGLWSVDLIPNELITPANTVYLAVTMPIGLPNVRSAFILPDNDDTHLLKDLLVEPPDDLPVEASLVAFHPSGGMDSTNVQAAIAEAYAHGGGGGGASTPFVVGVTEGPFCYVPVLKVFPAGEGFVLFSPPMEGFQNPLNTGPGDSIFTPLASVVIPEFSTGVLGVKVGQFVIPLSGQPGASIGLTLPSVSPGIIDLTDYTPTNSDDLTWGDSRWTTAEGGMFFVRAFFILSISNDWAV